MAEKKKLTLQQKLDKKKYKIPSRVINKLYHVIGQRFLARPYNAHYKIIDDINDCKGPCFLIYNHLSRRDHLFFSQAAYPRRINILAGYNEFFRKSFHTVFNLMNVIPKKNFCNDLPSMKAISSIIKKGGCVCFSPEGMSSIYGHNQPIVAGTGHFFKHFKVPVYMLKIRGSYLTSNKVCIDDRHGKVEAELFKLFSPEDFLVMTDEEVGDKINEVMRHDDYDWNKTARIKYDSHGKICTRLNDICYKCPKCGAELKMTAHDDRIECEVCGNGAKMNDFYDFLPYNETCIIPVSPSKWVDWERIQVINEIRENPDLSFSANVKVGYLPPYRLIKKTTTSEPCGEGKITVDKNGIHFVGTKLGKEWSFDLSYKTVYSLVIVNDLTYFSLYINGEYHDFTPDTPCVGKILLLVEEFHRYTYNVWKNFKWDEFMYDKAKSQSFLSDNLAPYILPQEATKKDKS